GEGGGMSAVLAQGIPIALLVAVLVPGVQQLLRPVHPGRLLAEALSSGFLLLVVGTLLGLPGHWSLLWWAALAVSLAGVAAGTARALRVTGPAPALRAARDARALRTATAAPTVAAGEGEAGPRPGGTAPAHPPEHD